MASTTNLEVAEARRKALLARLNFIRQNPGGAQTLFNSGSVSGDNPLMDEVLDTIRNGSSPDSNRGQEIQSVRAQRDQYSKGQAQADAEGLVSQQQRKALDELIPAINNASRGAGTSQGSMRALLLNQASTQAAEASSAAGLQASVDYGRISAGLSNTLEALTRADNSQAQLLLEAMRIGQANNNSGGSSNAGDLLLKGGVDGVTARLATTSTMAPSRNFSRVNRIGRIGQEREYNNLGIGRAEPLSEAQLQVRQNQQNSRNFSSQFIQDANSFMRGN